MAIEPRRYKQLRVPYRSKTRLRSFRTGIDPVISDIGVDKITLKIEGTCTANGGDARDTLASYFTEFPGFAISEFPNWFLTPSVRQHSHSHRIKTRDLSGADRLQTLGGVEVRLSSLPRGRGWKFSIWIRSNPTRTLAHLIARFDDIEPASFVSAVTLMHPLEFFTATPSVERSLDGRTNWIADYEALYSMLGTDPFGTFAPIYLDKIKEFAEAVASPVATPAFVPEREVLAMRDQGLEIAIDTARIGVPQAEVYFERYFGHAVAGMREASLRALDQLRSVETTLFPNGQPQLASDRESISRQSGSLMITTSLPYHSKLVIYAKARKRLRFEMRRNKAVSWNEAGTSFEQPMQRVLARINQDRTRWVDGGGALRWQNIFAFFEEPKRPHMGDLVQLVNEIVTAGVQHGASTEALISSLIGDGGSIAADTDGIDLQVLHALERRGILQRVRVARREGRDFEARYSLTPEYLTVVQELALLPTIRDVIE